jgi:hypothetical protein
MEMDLKGKNSWQMHERELKRALGLPERQVKRLDPDVSTDWIWVDNVKVCVITSAQAKLEAPKSRFGHRVLACCPYCGVVVSAGRFGQHMKVHKNG